MRGKNGERCEISVAWEPVRKIACIFWNGDVSLEVLRAQAEIFRLHYDVTELTGVIVDFSGTRDIRLTPNELLTFANDEPLFPAGFSRVMVAAKDLHFGLLRMYENLSSERRQGTTVVRTLQEAYAALELSNPVFVPLPRRRRE